MSTTLVNRRTVFTGLVATTVINGEAHSRDLKKQIEVEAMALASSLTKMHGGNWLIKVDHKERVALVMSTD